MMDLKEFNKLSKAEEKLLEASLKGERAIIGDGALPVEGEELHTIRASFIRYLLLGNDPKLTLHAKGIRLRGAIISGVLDLQGSECGFDLTFSRCRFERAPSLINARIRGLYLGGSLVPGLSADNCVFDGSVFMRSGFQSTKEISMPGARISGDLQICDARISGQGGFGIFATSLEVQGSVYLGDYPYDDANSELYVDGVTEFSSLRVKRDFYCSNCALSAEANPDGKRIFTEGNDNGIPISLSLNRAEIGGVLYLKHNQISRGAVNLAGAIVRRLNDEPTGDGVAYRIRLDGFEYGGFSDETDTRLKPRLEWLDRRPDGVAFSAQPYEHLASVLNKLGHRNDAHEILIRKERLQRRVNREFIRKTKTDLWRLPLLTISDTAMRMLIGYGYRPIRALIWGLFLIVAMSFFFNKTWNAGDMAPNTAPILISKDWISATHTHPENPAKFWSSIGEAGQDYETFNAVAYSADLLIPIVNLGQEDAWAPSTSRSPWGWHAWWVRWVAKVLGWVITALGAAAVTGAIRKI